MSWSEIIGDKLDEKIWRGTLPPEIVEIIIEYRYEMFKIYNKCMYKYITTITKINVLAGILPQSCGDDTIDIYNYMLEDIIKQVENIFNKQILIKYSDIRPLNGEIVILVNYDFYNFICECLELPDKSDIYPAILNKFMKKRRLRSYLNPGVFMYRLKRGLYVVRVGRNGRRTVTII